MIGRAGLRRRALCGAGHKAPTHAPAESLLTHEPGHAFAAGARAGSAQGGGHARAAIGGAAVLVHLADLLAQQLIGLLTQTGLATAPGVVAAARDGEGRAQAAQGVMALHSAYPLEALLWGSAKIPKVFFSMSRCCWVRSNSALRARIWSWRSATLALGWGAGGPKRFLQSRRFQLLTPSSAATCLAFLPLDSQCSTAERLKDSS